MRLTINNDCCACSYCYRACQFDAPYYDGEQVRIDNSKCVGCGKCVAACPMGAIYDADQPPKAAEPHEPVTYDCDALIIGAGGSGMVAAVRIAEETGKKVIVLEKAKRTGAGAIHVAGGMEFTDTKWALDKGAKPVLDERIKSVIEKSQGLLDPKLVENTLRAMPRFFDWLCQWGSPEEKFELTQGRGGPGGPPMPGGDMPGAPGGMPGMPGGAPGGVPGMPGPGGDMLEGGTGGFLSGAMPGMNKDSSLTVEYTSLRPESPAFKNSGQFIMERLFKRAEELGVTILRQTPAQEFILDQEGQVIGVKAEDPGGQVTVCCKSCLIATGSLLLSDTLKKVEPDYADAWMPRFAHAINVYTGDGAAMCEKAGIPIDYDNVWLNITGSLVMPCDALTVEYSEATGKRPLIPTDLRPHSSRPESLMVNLNGQRWDNEQRVSATVKNQMKQPQCVSYAIYDDKLIKSDPMPHKTLLDEDGKPMRQMVPMAMRVEWNQEHMDWLNSLKNSHLVIADTLEEMAQRIGMPVDAFTATVERYNQLCAKGVDEDFGKDPDYLKPIEQGPFYAVRTFLMSDGVEGGIAIDSNCQVKGKNGLMKGLYAAGDNASGNIVRQGDGKMGITNEYSWAIASGMIAADSMIRQLKGE